VRRHREASHPVFQPSAFGKYFLTRRLAVGGMAEVFAAKLYGTDGFEKDLVIKQILPQYAKDPEFVQSFVGEAKIAVSLNHANVVSIYELGRVDGTYFIAMEYVDGMDLFSLIDACKRHGFALTVGAALLILEDVAKGLDYAHRKLGPDGLPLGLVHRDLNPRNVLISKEGEVKILDFGIAKTASRVAQMPKTRAGVVKGTTGYMSPEQATGREIDARTDIYQAGLLLYEALTGEALFWRPDDEATRELMRRHRIVAPSERVPDVPKEVDGLVFETLERDPGRRPQTAADLANRLARLRFLRYPDITHADLGALVAELAARDAALHAAKVPEPAAPPPLSFDLAEVISKALENSTTGDIETIARAPGAMLDPRFPSGRPATGSEPIAIREGAPLEPPPLLDASEASLRAAQAALNLGAPLSPAMPAAANNPAAAPPAPSFFGRTSPSSPSAAPVGTPPPRGATSDPPGRPGPARPSSPPISAAVPAITETEPASDDGHDRRGWRKLFDWLGKGPGG
jgi:serine/threonine protein kinase